MECDNKTVTQALFEAVNSCNITQCKALISAGADVKDQVDANGTPLLHAAIIVQQGDIVKLLIEHGSDVNCIDNIKRTALHIAIMCDQAHITKILLDNGADVNYSDCLQFTPLERSLFYSNLEAFQLLLNYGASLYKVDGSGNTILHYAVIYRRFAFVETLLKCGMTVDVQNKYGRSPLDIGTTPEIYSLLRSYITTDSK